MRMTYGKYVEMHLCCFIPGRVLDETFAVLRTVDRALQPATAAAAAPLRPHDLLQELRDISSMAMEHFDEHVVPQLRIALTPTFQSSSMLMAAASSSRLQSKLPSMTSFCSANENTGEDILANLKRVQAHRNDRVQPLREADDAAVFDADLHTKMNVNAQLRE